MTPVQPRTVSFSMAARPCHSGLARRLWISSRASSRVFHAPWTWASERTRMSAADSRWGSVRVAKSMMVIILAPLVWPPPPPRYARSPSPINRGGSAGATGLALGFGFERQAVRSQPLLCKRLVALFADVADAEDAELVEEVHGHREADLADRVGGRDEGSEDEDADDGVAAAL